MRQTLRKANQYYQTTVVLVIDNAPCHSRAETILHEEEFIGNVLLRLAPYSPMLNAIEEAWSVLKSGVKTDLGLDMNSILTNEDRGNLTQTEYRLRRLEAIIGKNISSITATKCRSFVAHVQRFLAPAINREDMTF